jgi:hypothetical protein
VSVFVFVASGLVLMAELLMVPSGAVVLSFAAALVLVSSVALLLAASLQLIKARSTMHGKIYFFIKNGFQTFSKGHIELTDDG